MPKQARWKQPDQHEETQSVTRASKVMGMARDTFQNLANAGFIRPNAAGLWDTRLLVDQLAAYQAEASAKPKGSKGEVDPELSRLRSANADIKELELASRRGELVDRDAIHVAFSQVVETVKADLLALTAWGAVELASCGSEEIEKRLGRKAAAIALGFERKCGDVRLIAQPKPAKEKATRDSARKRKARKGK